MSRLDQNASTSPDGGGGWFATTHWSVVLNAGEEDSARTQDALEALCRAYWYPLFAFVRGRGHSPEEAQDLTQAFFARFLEKNLVRRVDRDKGRFRSFLLASMKFFLANERDRASALKRGGGCCFTPWEEGLDLERSMHAEPPAGLSPDQNYERQWALALLEQVFARLRAECAAAGKKAMFEVLEVHLSGEKSVASYADAAARLQMTSGAVQVAVHRLRRRYGELLRAEIANTVSGPDEIDDELRQLFAALRS